MLHVAYCMMAVVFDDSDDTAQRTCSTADKELTHSCHQSRLFGCAQREVCEVNQNRSEAGRGGGN